MLGPGNSEQTSGVLSILITLLIYEYDQDTINHAIAIWWHRKFVSNDLQNKFNCIHTTTGFDVQRNMDMHICT